MSADDTADAGLRAELDQVERDTLRRVDPGPRAVVIAVALLALLVAMVLPWVGDASGWAVLRGAADPAAQVGLLPRLFGTVAMVVGVGVSALALVTRRWGLVWAGAFGCALVTLEGVWAIWSRQTAPDGPGPGIGLVLATVAAAVLAAQWFRLAFSRS